MNKIAFIYPGQGSQKPGMGKDFFDNSQMVRELYEEASQICGLDMKKLCFEENEQLNNTAYTQCALVTTCLAMTKVYLEKTGITPDITAGLSLGEYCAIEAAGGFSFPDAVGLVRERGKLMEYALPKGFGTMAAVLGAQTKLIEAVVGAIKDVSIANYNCPGQIVITGKKAAVEQAIKLLKDQGVKRIMPLNVSGPFHSPFLKEAGEKLKIELEKIRLYDLKIPYVTNVTANQVLDIKETATLLTQQISAPVLWEQSMRNMIAEGVDLFVEIGPGKTLNSFLRKINKEVQVINISKWEDIHE
ncbi:MAG TPA: ACP S-malonyltransferase [Candidatus Dorea intestinavium]|nr:ACP S-malonyltransferase [Candidatus Dorea intestinavium]